MLVSTEIPVCTCVLLFILKFCNTSLVCIGINETGHLPTYGIETENEEELQKLMSKSNEWGLNVFELDSVSNHQPLTAVAYTLLKNRGLITKFSLNPYKVISFFSTVEKLYHETNPYHNRMHAADVAQTTHVFLSSNMLKNLTALEIFAAIFAASIHDVDHPGLSNKFLVNTNSEYAVKYHDTSVLEHHHLETAFKILQNANCNILESLNELDKQKFRKLVNAMVLSTDNAMHNDLLLKFNRTMNSLINLNKSSTEMDHVVVLQTIIHLADISNPLKSLTLFKQWTERIIKEFWNQGDLESQLGMEISPLCDRNNTDIPKSQVGFIDHVVEPFWKLWTHYFPEFSNLRNQLKINRNYYESLIKT